MKRTKPIYGVLEPGAVLKPGTPPRTGLTRTVANKLITIREPKQTGHTSHIVKFTSSNWNIIEYIKHTAKDTAGKDTVIIAKKLNGILNKGCRIRTSLASADASIFSVYLKLNFNLELYSLLCILTVKTVTSTKHFKS